MSEPIQLQVYHRFMPKKLTTDVTISWETLLLLLGKNGHYIPDNAEVDIFVRAPDGGDWPRVKRGADNDALVHVRYSYPIRVVRARNANNGG